MFLTQPAYRQDTRRLSCHSHYEAQPQLCYLHDNTSDCIVSEHGRLCLGL